MKKLVCFLMVIVLAFSLTACGGSGYKSVVKDYVKAMEKCDGEAMLKLLPEEYIEYAIDEEYFEDEDEAIDSLEDMLDMSMDYLEDEYGKDIKLSYEITDEDELDEDELDDLQDEYDEFDLEVKQALVLEVELTVKGDDDKDTEDIEIVVVKIGSKWYLDVTSGLF